MVRESKFVYNSCFEFIDNSSMNNIKFGEKRCRTTYIIQLMIVLRNQKMYIFFFFCHHQHCLPNISHYSNKTTWFSIYFFLSFFVHKQEEKGTKILLRFKCNNIRRAFFLRIYWRSYFMWTCRYFLKQNIKWKKIF